MWVGKTGCVDVDGVRRTRNTNLVLSVVLVFLVRTLLSGCTFAAASDASFGSSCPDEWQDAPVDQCLGDLRVFLSRDQAHLAPGEKKRQECSLWYNAKHCIENLIVLCPGSSDELMRRLNTHAQVSSSCYTDHTILQENMRLCFRPWVGSTNSCLDTFNQRYTDFVESKSNHNACRILSTVIQCLHTHRQEILAKCQEEGADQYLVTYIQPVVEQVNSDIKRICKLPPPLDQYLNQATNMAISSSSSTMVCCSLIAMVTNVWFIHWSTWIT